MATDLRAALDELFRRASTYGTFEAQRELQRSIDDDPVGRLGANDVDSALVRWADTLGLAAVPLEVDEAAEHVVTTLEVATDAGARV